MDLATLITELSLVALHLAHTRTATTMTRLSCALRTRDGRRPQPAIQALCIRSGSPARSKNATVEPALSELCRVEGAGEREFN